jgi:hypothetical protein
LVGDQDVFRFEVPVVDAVGMTILYGIQDLKESHLDKGVISNEHTSLRDIGEKISLRAVFHDHICTVICLEDLHHGDYVGVSTGLDMEMDFPLLEFLLTRLQSKFVECFDSIRDVGLDVYGSIDNPISSNSKDSGQLNLSGENLS